MPDASADSPAGPRELPHLRHDARARDAVRRGRAQSGTGKLHASILVDAALQHCRRGDCDGRPSLDADGDDCDIVARARARYARRTVGRLALLRSLHRSIRHRSPNMWTLIGIGVATAYV